MAQCNQCGKKGLFFHVNTEGLCDECNSLLVSSLQTKMNQLNTPEYQNLTSLEDKISKAEQTIQNLENKADELRKDLSQKRNEKTNLQNQIVTLEDDVLVQSFGLYTPKYDFSNSTKYKDRLTEVRQKQKDMIKYDIAVLGDTNWSINGSNAQGRKMVKSMQKLVLRAFNSECDELIDKVKYNNYDSIRKRITSSKDAISKLGTIMRISISYPYYELKLEELDLAFEYRQKKQQEKEEQKELRAQMREEARLQKALEEERKKLEKEQIHYENALHRLEAQLTKDPENADLLQKKAELSAGLDDVNKAIKDVDYREANKKAGYVYVISNIGAFGENVYKIGMTRRLDPTERVDELGDASVPFNFDIHAMIFSEDAPKLEAALHQAFSDRKLNMVNTRREFFNVTLDEIKEEISKNFDKTVDFVDVPDAEQFRISQKVRQQTL